jgi:hypothetical protein
MNEQSKKKPIIIDSSETSIDTEKLKSSQEEVLEEPVELEDFSSGVPDTSSSVPDTSTLLDDSEELDVDNLQEEYEKLGNCKGENYYSSDCNKFLLKKELIERNYLEEQGHDETPHLYPNLNDKEFNIKIATKKEFNDTKYDGKIYDNIKEQADILAKADFELQPHQAFVKNFMSFQTPYNSLLLNHGLGTGKCMKKGTPIMMSDGSIELVENIKEGDFLMGDDSKPRRVLSIARGKDKMYDIIPVKGDKYTVNQEHILCLKASGFPKLCRNNYKANTNYNIQWIQNNQFQTKTFSFQEKTKNNELEIKAIAESFYNSILSNPETSDNVLEISVKDYLELSDKKKSLLKGYKVPIDFPEKDLPIDPYMIGYWLGDGTTRESAITSQDSRVLYYFAKNLPKYKVSLIHRIGYQYGITGSGRVNENPFLNTLKELNLLNNKHIPMLYKCNSRENRLKLLAGLLDSDGYFDNVSSCFEFTQKNEVLMDDVIYLARSLGFACYKATKNTSWTYKGTKNIGIVYRIHISGAGLEQIPTQIPRKRAIPRKQIKDALVTGIRVEYVNEDDYYGFTLDGNCRYLMGDFSVTHNTCSAIGICEEMRDYMKQMGIKKRIIIVASENVQDNFKTQLFDERKLKLTDGVWNIRGCTGNKLLQEINPMNMRGMTKDKVVSQIKGLINTYYIFLGYVQFANYIIKTMNYTEEVQKQRREKKDKRGKKATSRIQMLKDVKIELNERIIARLKKEFDNRLIVIDEVHNIRKTEDNENKKVAINLELLVKSAENMRFLLLSATPMYNSYKEIIWLLNLMNTNDRRGRIEVRDIFDKHGNFKKQGEELLIRKATGYISFVRGENPYTFPYRVYPNEFAKEHTFPAIKYPSYQMNLKKIKHEDKKRILSLYLNKLNDCGTCGKCQLCAYRYIIYNLRNKQFTITTKTGIVRDMPNFENMESFGYTLLQTPLESLIISYPVQGLKEILDAIPIESAAEDFSQSFSEMSSDEEENIKKDEEKELTGPIEEINDGEESEFKKKKIIVQSSSSENTLLDSGITLLDSGSSEKTLVGGAGPDPHLLTGRIGLERMMTFIDNRSPPLKGDFEYKKATLEKYGKIFSREQIGLYSSKIKTILDNIMNSETGVIGEGVILIYSQYIDSGLIPMALALEEYGFTRYGDNGAKPLFKHAPTPVVDVRTMKPKGSGTFMPARYAMITGEPRLSPNNDFEVKGLTGEDNKDGHKVKVVLISKAGSEGIDFKFIRQVHILEPWYNMNRIEQIIGRAVRNFSHKDLPFEKRNVEIFMYGTILGENKEEAADLYVYRVAEYKAVQIGKVSRLLKETAVDCIIHHDQTNFTQEIMNASLKEPITQILSNGEVLNNFKVGDAPFSPACDYMAQCNYDCRPDKDIDENDLNQDTYSEKFILMNSEKILQRIRMLMKENFFYKKDNLLKLIQTPKEYPYVQIFSALTLLIDEENEFITDKYGRDGRLVNIGEYYLFQPVELRDKNISLFDRSVPIDYKHDMVKFSIKPEIARSVIDKRNIPAKREIVESLEKEEGEEKEKKQEPLKSLQNMREGKKVLDEMRKNFDISLEYTKKIKIPRGEDDWYKYCGLVMKKMTKEYPESKELLIPFLVSHMIELQLFDEKLELMNYLYSLDRIQKQSLEWYAKEYFEMNSMTTRKYTAFIMYKLGKINIMILNEKNEWIPAEPEQQREIATDKNIKEMLTFNAGGYNKIIGFIGYEKSNRYLVFKTKDIASKRDTGARCDESGKIKTMEKLNEIIGEEKYTKESTKIQKQGKEIISEAIGQVELCILQEFILRYFNTIKKDGKKWFLIPEFALWYKMYTIT